MVSIGGNTRLISRITTSFAQSIIAGATLSGCIEYEKPRFL